jgi:peroxiredoxin
VRSQKLDGARARSHNRADTGALEAATMMRHRMQGSTLAGVALGITVLVACTMSRALFPAASASAAARVNAIRAQQDEDEGAGRKAAPDFTLEDASGARVKLSKYRGEVVLLNFWATWCHGCQTEIPWFIEYESKYKQNGLAIIGVSMDDDGWKVVTPFVAEKKMNYTVVLGDEKVSKLFAVNAMPVTLLIDREGRIAASYSDVVDRAACEKKIQALLRENAKPLPKAESGN